MNYVTIAILSIIVVGLMEVVKNFLPENTNAKVKSGISLVLALALPIVYGIAYKVDPFSIVANTFGVVGLTQTSYNFVLKLFKAAIEKLKANIDLNKVVETATEGK